MNSPDIFLQRQAQRIVDFIGMDKLDLAYHLWIASMIINIIATLIKDAPTKWLVLWMYGFSLSLTIIFGKNFIEYVASFVIYRGMILGVSLASIVLAVLTPTLLNTFDALSSTLFLLSLYVAICNPPPPRKKAPKLAPVVQP